MLVATEGSISRPERLILETTDERFVRKLHTMRAARSVLEHEGGRWEITRIASAEGATADQTAWQVFGRRARPA